MVAGARRPRYALGGVTVYGRAGRGLLALVASVVFVGVQLRQERVIARSELAAGTADYLATIDQTMADPDFASVYA